MGEHVWPSQYTIHATCRVQMKENCRRVHETRLQVFTVFADCRKRVDPPMPKSYFGNLIQAIFMVTAVGLLSMNPPEFGASMIQKAIETHDAKVIEERHNQLYSEFLIDKQERASYKPRTTIIILQCRKPTKINCYKQFKTNKILKKKKEVVFILKLR